MDSIFGIEEKDFVLLAADCKVARSILVYKDKTTRHNVLVASGPPRDRLAFAPLQPTTVVRSTRSYYVRRELARFLRRAPYQVNLLIGAVDAEQKTEPTLHWIGYHGSMVKVNFGAHGCSAYFCLSIFDREWKPEMRLDEAKDVLKKCHVELNMRFLESKFAFLPVIFWCVAMSYFGTISAITWRADQSFFASGHTEGDNEV